jgi:hypothetical protein
LAAASNAVFVFLDFYSYRQYDIRYAAPLQASLNCESGLVMKQPVVKFLKAKGKSS